MNHHRAISAIIRVTAALVAAAGLFFHHAPVRAATPAMRQQPAMVIVPNMMAYWPMETATAGITPDLSPNLNDGTLNGGAAISTANHAAIPAGNTASLALTGPTSTDYVIVPDSPSLSVTGAFTLSAWIRPTLAAGGNQKGILEKWDWSGSDATNGFLFRLDASNNLSFAVCDATVSSGISTAPRTVPLNTWTHVAATCAANGAMTIYMGGNADPTTGTSAGLPTNGTSELHIGADYGTNRFGGNIDEARIYNRELSPAEIVILRDGQAAATGLVAAGGAGQIVLNWTAPVNATQYSLLRGTVSGTYTTVINNIMTPTYTDTTVTPGTPYFYAVVAISVMAGANSNEVTATAAPAGPPPPPPPPRTTKNPDHGRCGVSTIPAPGFYPGTAAAGILASLLLISARRLRRNR